MKALFISGIDYESPIQIGDHQLARQFAMDGWKVAFLSTPVTPLHIFGKGTSNILRRFHNYRSGGFHHKIGKGTIWSYVPGAVVFPRNYFPLNQLWVYQYWHLLTIPSVLNQLKRNGFEQVDLLYMRDPIQASYLDLVPHKRAIYRVADNDGGFSTYNSKVAANEKQVAGKVDLVVYSAQELETHVQKLAPAQFTYLPNGVDYKHFAEANREMPEAIKDIPDPMVIYAGSIDNWFDFDLINQLTADLPNISFIIIGPNERFRSRFIARKNLYLLGPVSYDLLPGYLWQAAAGIIPFNVESYPELVNSISPIKLYEYMACGLPVIASNWKELRNINSPALLCQTPSDFKIAIQVAIESKRPSSDYTRFAEMNDWSYRYQQLTARVNLEQ